MTQLDFMHLDLDCPALPVAVLTNDKYSDPLRQSVCHPHWHRQWELHYVTAGELELVIDHVTYFLQPGDVAIINTNQLHQSFCTQRLKELVLIFDLSHLSEELAQQNFTCCSVIRSNPVLCGYLDHFWQEYFQDLPGKLTICKGILLEFLVFLCRDHMGTPPGQTYLRRQKQLDRLQPVCHYIETHYAEQISFHTLAQLIHVSHDRFHHMFKQIMGISPGRYINEVRLHAAMRLLKERNCSAATAAEACGFLDYNYFGRLFLRTFGCTPSKVRSAP